MKKLFIFFGLFISLNFAVAAQELISSSGDFFKNSEFSVSWSVGEPITETVSNTSNIFTQGFHQSLLNTSVIYELSDIEFQIKIAPNPVSDFLTLTINKSENLSYELYDFNGKLLEKKKIQAENTIITFNRYAFAAYFLKILKNNQNIKIYQVIKQ